MKKLLVAVGFAVASLGAQADIVNGNLTLAGNGTTVLGGDGFNPSATFGGPAFVTVGAGNNILTGTLQSNVFGIFTATYLGKEAGYTNFYLDGALNSITGDYASVGNTASVDVLAGTTVSFAFRDKDGVVFNNGDANTAIRGIGYFVNTFGLKDKAGNLFDFLIGYNDSFPNHADFDDFVVGVRVVETPLPAALPLLATGLGLFGLSRRRSV